MGNIGIITDLTLGTKASTTGNVTGIYDMSGGAAEYVMGNYNNTVSYSEFTTFPESKYYDLYLESQFDGDYETNMQLCTLDTCGGHALYETSNWYLDNNNFVYSMFPWFVRGGDSCSGFEMGAFASGGSSGSDGESHSWRSVLIVGE